MPVPSSDLTGRRVLVVEDETLITMLLEDALDEMGCELAGAASRYQDAMDKATSLAFDVAILDVNLSGEKTFPIAAALAERGVPFVFSTGYGAGSLPAPLQKTPILHKPFQLLDLERALHAAMDAKV